MSRLDPFLLAHHELNTMEPAGDKPRFLHDTFTRASMFARFPIALPSSHQLIATGHVQTHEKVFELHVMTTNVPYMMRLTNLERALFELITIHKLYLHYDRENVTDRERRSRAVLGCMIQHRLTRLLLEAHYEEFEKIFLLGHASGINQEHWESHFVGAASCARTISTFLELEECRIFLPTVVEDLILGVDLIVLNEERDNWCVAIKSGAPRMPMHIEHVHTRPHEQDPAYRSADRRRIFDGAYDMSREYEGKFRPCRVIVGKTNERFYDLSVYEDDVDRVRSFIDTDRSKEYVHRIEGIESLPRAANGDAA